jgi:hypothetical protein
MRSRITTGISRLVFLLKFSYIGKMEVSGDQERVHPGPAVPGLSARGCIAVDVVSHPFDGAVGNLVL